MANTSCPWLIAFTRANGTNDLRSYESTRTMKQALKAFIDLTECGDYKSFKVVACRAKPMSRADAIGKLIASLVLDGMSVIDAALQIDEVTGDESHKQVVARAMKL